MLSMTNKMRGRSSTLMELDEEVLLEEEGDLVEMDKKKEEERMTNSISISPHGLLPCPLCRADISLRAGTLAKVISSQISYWNFSHLYLYRFTDTWRMPMGYSTTLTPYSR